MTELEFNCGCKIDVAYHIHDHHSSFGVNYAKLCEHHLDTLMMTETLKDIERRRRDGKLGSY